MTRKSAARIFDEPIIFGASLRAAIAGRTNASEFVGALIKNRTHQLSLFAQGVNAESSNRFPVSPAPTPLAAARRGRAAVIERIRGRGEPPAGGGEHPRRRQTFPALPSSGKLPLFGKEARTY